MKVALCCRGKAENTAIVEKTDHKRGITMEQAILEFEHVTGTSRKFHLEDINFSLPAGYLMGLAGKNGAGKTTLVDYIINPKQKYTGTIRLCGKDIREDHVACREYIGLVSDKNSFFTAYSAIQNVELLSGLYKKFNMDLFSAAMKRMELSTGKIVGTMSRGELMRFQMAFAMAHDTKLYLLDEATAGMDPVFRVDFFKILHEVIAKEDASVLMVTHIAEEVEHKMDYVGIMEAGRMVSFGENELQ